MSEDVSEGQPSTAQEQELDWQVKLEQLRNHHKQESLQQHKEHLEQLKLLQAQILTELTSESGHNLAISPGPLQIAQDSSIPVSPTSSKSTQPTSLPPPLSERPSTHEHNRALTLTRVHSSSDPQLFVGGVSPAHRPPPSSPGRSASSQCTPISSPGTKSLTQPQSDEDKKDGLPHLQSKGEGHGGLIIGSSFEFIASNTGLVRTSTTESLDQSSHDAVSTSVEVSPIKPDKHQQGEFPPPNRSSTEWQPPGSVEGEAINISHTPPQRKTAWTETSPQQSNIRHLSPTSPSQLSDSTMKTSPTSQSQSLTVQAPKYPVVRLSPSYGYTSPLTSGIHVRTSPSNSTSMASPAVLGSSGGRSPLGDSQSRATLVEKHRKHMDDVKRYYESELSDLRDRIQRLEADKNEPLSSTITNVNARRSVSPLPTSFGLNPRSPQHPTPLRPNPTRQLYFPSSLVKGRAVTPASLGAGGDGMSGKNGGGGGGDVPPNPAVNESELWMVQNENSRLKGECCDLRNQLDETDREKRALEEQVKRLQEHSLDWKERLEASERMVTVLHERLESTRSQLYDQDKLIGQLRSELQVAAEELQYWKEQRSQDMEKIEQLFEEFEVLQQENDNVRSANSQLQCELEEAQRKTTAYKVTVDKYQALEAQYKSTIQELEDEVRHLQHVNNRLHSMGTHYQLGNYGSPFNQPDEAKVQASPRSTSRDVAPLPSTPQTTEAHDRKETPLSNSVARVPLTRRKWLESSIPGLVIGGGEGGGVEETAGREQAAHSESLPSRTQPGITSTPSRLPAMVNMSSGLKESKRRSPSKRQPSSSPGHQPDSSSHSLTSEQQAVKKVVLKEDSSGGNPANYEYNRKWHDGGTSESNLAESALKAIRSGNVIGASESGHSSNLTRKKSRSSREKQISIEERVKKHMQTVAEAEQKLAALQKERETLESSLLKTPRAGSRATRQAKQTKLEAERRLEEVVREIGSVRMLLRRHHALK